MNYVGQYRIRKCTGDEKFRLSVPGLLKTFRDCADEITAESDFGYDLV